MNGQEKKRAYNERVLQIEHGMFTPLVFSIYRSMGRKCRTFYSRLSDLLSERRDLPKSITMNWVRTKICSVLLKSSLLCLRGSRTVWRKGLHGFCFLIFRWCVLSDVVVVHSLHSVIHFNSLKTLCSSLNGQKSILQDYTNFNKCNLWQQQER